MDIRSKYWLAAEDQLRESQQHEKITLGFWANLLVALVNACMAVVPDSVMDDIEAQRASKAALQRRVSKKIRDDLEGK